ARSLRALELPSTEGTSRFQSSARAGGTALSRDTESSEYCETPSVVTRTICARSYRTPRVAIGSASDLFDWTARGEFTAAQLSDLLAMSGFRVIRQCYCYYNDRLQSPV